MLQSSVFSFNDSNRSDSDSLTVFPKPPIHLIPSKFLLPFGRSEFNGSEFSDDDSHSENTKISVSRKKSADFTKLLPPIGVFWDIENCHVPKGRSATAVAQAIRDRFFEGYREADFVVVCDVTKEKSLIIQELNDAQVNLIHVAAICKNAADEKLRQSIRRFADTHLPPAAIILISGDVNFAGDLNDLRHRKKIHVILIHQTNVSKALLMCASEHYSLSEIVENVPMRDNFQIDKLEYKVIVSNLPKEKEPAKVKTRLKQLCENSGGRVGHVYRTLCTIRFPTIEFAIRARKRMDGQDVFGNKIIMSDPIPMEDWNYNVRRAKKFYPKEETESSGNAMPPRRGVKEDAATFHFNDLYSGKAVGNEENAMQNLDPSFHQQLTKSTVPFFSNNISNFTFPKVPNIENLKVIQNHASQGQKSYLNNLDGGGTGRGFVGEHKKTGPDNRKFNNVLANQTDTLNVRWARHIVAT